MGETNLLQQVQGLMATANPADLGPGPRDGAQPLDVLKPQLEATLATHAVSNLKGDLIRATVLLWHDLLDASHKISQGIDNADGSYVHGLMHRREPDYWNSKYWFRRVGTHPCYPELANRVAALLQSHNDTMLGSQLLPAGQWDPHAFVTACNVASGRPAGDARVRLLKAIQALEFELLLERFCQQ